MEINRVWAMPNKWTFTIEPIAELLKRYNVGKNWIDPFAGMNSPAEITNDLNPEMKTTYNMRANDFLLSLNKEYLGGIFDPPYNLSQLKECYDNVGEEFMKEDCNYAYSKPKDLLAKKIKYMGFVICCGWNTVGLGMDRGFKLLEVLLVCHGGHHNDTIVTVEQKVDGQISLI